MGDSLGTLQDNQKNSYTLVDESGEDRVAQRVYVHGGTIVVDAISSEVEVINDVGNPIPVSFVGTGTGLATEAKQDVGNASLASIDAKLTAPIDVSGTVALDAGTLAALENITVQNEVEIKNDVDNPISISATSLPLPTGASTSALQTSGNASLSSIDSKLVNGNDIGDVTVNNGAGVAAVNIQDGGNSITVDGTITADQGGSWTVTANAGTNLNTSALSLESTQVAQNVLIGPVDEAAPGTDVSNSGLNGRLQRIAQRLTSLIALFPISIGQKTASGSLSVVLSSDENNVTANAGTNLNTSALNLETTQLLVSNRIGDLTETAPVSDTASSGLNGRLQRIAQRVTSLITAVTDKTQWTKLTDGTQDAVIKAASTYVDTADAALVIGNSPFNYTRIKAATTTTVKSGAGVLHTISINTQANGTATVYDSTTGAGTIIALITTTNNISAWTAVYDIKFNTGLTIVTSSANPDYTVTWK